MSDMGGGGDNALTAVVDAEIEKFVSKMSEVKDKAGETTDAIEKSATEKGDAVGGAFDGMGAKVLAGGLVVAGVAAKIGQDWNNMSKEMSTQTGATGAALDGLMSSVQGVAGTVKASMGDIGDVVSDVAAKTKLTGPPLEELTRRFLELKDLGISLQASAVTATFSGWGIAAGDMAARLDDIFRAAQTVGIPMGTLLDRLSALRPVLQGMGFDFTQSSLIVGRLSEQTLPGFQKALLMITKAHADQAGAAKDVAAAQKEYDAAVRTSGATSIQATEAAAKLKEAQLMLALGTQAPKEAFATLVSSIKGAANEQDALAIGMAAFGAKAAVPMTAAIRAGKFDLDGLTAAAAKNTNTIHGTDQAHMTFIDRLGMLKTKLEATAGPYAQAVSGVAAFLAPMKQAGESIGGFIDWIRKLKTAREAAAAASVVEATATTTSAGTTAIAGASAATASTGFFAFAGSIWAAMAPLLPIIAVLALVGIAAYELYQHWDGAWSGITNTIQAAWNTIGNVISGAWDTLKGIFNSIVQACKDAIEWIGKALDKVSAGSLLNVATFGLSDALGFAQGGTVPGPIGAPRLSIVHGGEEIRPPGGSVGSGTTGGGGGPTVIINLHGSVFTERDIEGAVQTAMGSLARRGATMAGRG